MLVGLKDRREGRNEKIDYEDVELEAKYQLRVVGQRFLEFDVAGSRVAFAHASVSARPMKDETRIMRCGGRLSEGQLNE